MCSPQLATGKNSNSCPLSQPTQPSSKGSSRLGQAQQQDCSRRQPEPGFPYPSDSGPQALKAEMLLRALHLSAPMYILAACLPSPALLLVPQDSEPHLPQILRAKKEHETSCPSTAGISSVSKEMPEHQGTAPQDAQQWHCTSSVVNAQLAGCCSQGKQNPGGRTDTHVEPQQSPWQLCLSLAAISAFTAGHRACHMGLLAYKQNRQEICTQARCPKLLLWLPALILTKKKVCTEHIPSYHHTSTCSYL